MACSLSCCGGHWIWSLLPPGVQSLKCCSTLSSCQRPLTDPSPAAQQGPPKPPNPTAAERRHGRLPRRPSSASWSSAGKERANSLLEVAHLRRDKRCHQSRAVGLPGAAAAQRLSRRAARNRAYRLIISALSHKEELGDGAPYLHSPPPVPAAAALVPARPLPRHCDGPASFSLMGWRRGAAAPHRPHHSLAGCLLLGRGGRRLHGSESVSDG